MITKEVAKNFRVDFAAAVQDLEKKFSIKIELGGIRYSETQFHVKLTAQSTITEDYKTPTYTFTPIIKTVPNMGVRFTWKTHQYKISGYNPKRWKKPIKLTRDDGKQMICTREFIESLKLPK